MSLHPAIVLLGGLVVLIVGAELLLRGGSRVAAMLGVQPLMVGMTVVAVATSAPELAVGITAASEGRGSLAVANIAGTNIFNILFILGCSAAFRPLPLQLQSIRLDVPVMIAAAVALLLMAWDGVLSRLEGLVLVAASIPYTVALIRWSRRESPEMRREFAQEYSRKALSTGHGARRAVWNCTLFFVGLGLTIVGADLLVAGAVSLARLLGVSDVIIGLTIVAIGTSAPEMATTFVATVKNERDIAIGNLIGSSISNILVILGTTCLVAPNGVDVSRDVLWIDLPLAAAVALSCYPVFRTGREVSRTEGVIFVLAYLGYLTMVLVLRAGAG